MRKEKVLVSAAILGLLITAITVSVSGGNGFSVYVPFVEFNNCPNWPTGTPAGALPGQPPPVFCLITNDGLGTEQPGQNAWYDDFEHDLSFATFDNTQYRLFNEIGAWRTIFWRHANHWMVDMAPHNQDGSSGAIQGYTLLRPEMSFQFSDDKLVVETTVSAGMAAYHENAWSEIVISNGPSPVDQYLSLYAYDLFPQHWTLGCRLQSSRVPVCALKANDGSPTVGSTRIWEMSFWQQVGTYSYGGYPFGGLENYWHECEVDESDANCRDHFRLELRPTSLKLYVNDGLYFEQSGIPPLPNALLQGDIYVYLASVHVRHPADTIRYHWDNFSINNPPAVSE